MTSTATHPDLDRLQRALPHVLAAPKDGAAIETICFRPGYNLREFPDRITLTRDRGIPGERWLDRPWMRLADGSPDPRIQVSILGRRVLDLVWRDRDATPHPGDTFIADMDFSQANLPAGTRLALGGAVLRVSDVFNDGCVKWRARYGDAAKHWITLPDNIPLRLRGILCEIVQDGDVKLGDQIFRL